MDHSQQARVLFTQGYNCAQSTAAPFAATYGLAESQVLQCMAGFGAGLSGLRETCGAVSAMVYLAGLHFGAYAPDDLSQKRALYDLTQALIREFVELHGTICCRELLEKAACPVCPRPSERSAEYYRCRPCEYIVATAAGIIARRLVAERG